MNSERAYHIVVTLIMLANIVCSTAYSQTANVDIRISSGFTNPDDINGLQAKVSNSWTYEFTKALPLTLFLQKQFWDFAHTVRMLLLLK